MTIITSFHDDKQRHPATLDPFLNFSSSGKKPLSEMKESISMNALAKQIQLQTKKLIVAVRPKNKRFFVNPYFH